MVEIKSDSPGDLLFNRLRTGGNFNSLPVTEFRFEHPSLDSPIILTQSDVAILYEMGSESPTGRDLAVLKEYPEGYWGRTKAIALENELIPSGLVQRASGDENSTAYELSQLADEGFYIAVIPDSE